MDKHFVGREKEMAILKETLTSGQSEMIAVVGRRRVGKTHMVKQAFDNLQERHLQLPKNTQRSCA